MHDDIPDNPRGFLEGFGCLLLALASAACSIAVIFALFELVRAIARWCFS